MINQKTKFKKENEFQNVKFILTSTVRTQLLLCTYENPKKLDELRNDLNKSSASILHGLRELEEKNLIKKDQKKYELTSNGFLFTTNLIKLIENWNSINKNKIFWNTHDLSGIPDKLLKNIYLLKDAEYVNSTTSDLSKAFNTYIDLISNTEMLKMILPIYSENHFKQIIQLLNQNKLKKIELIISENILHSIERNTLFNEALLKNEKVNVKCIKRKLKLFLTYSDTFMTLTLFFNDGHYDDSQILIAKNKNALKWASSLLKYY